jgi:uncharacterized membrane protein
VLVLYALGACMLILAALLWLPPNVLAFVSLATIVLHNALDPIRAQSLGSFGPVWIVLHQLGAFPLAGRILISPYPLIPWFAVMALGFCLGPLFEKSAEGRQRHLLKVGAILTIGFVLVRALNIYGDPSRWSAQPSMAMTLVSFLNVTKNPPSLSFLLMTLGPALIVLSRFDRLSFSRANPLIVFGRVPLFYFVLHFFAAHLAAVVMALAAYGAGAMQFMWQPLPSMGGPAKEFPPEFGYPLWVAYAVWIVIVVGLYPVCRWFAGVKERSRSRWLSYL